MDNRYSCGIINGILELVIDDSMLSAAGMLMLSLKSSTRITNTMSYVVIGKGLEV